MNVIASKAAAELISAEGGRLFVSLRRGRCCGATITLIARTSTANQDSFVAAASVDGFELFLPRNLGRVPTEIHVELRRRSNRIEAFWNGCAWVT
jgi:hypothetical protein